jgi:hypothetical protein
MSGLFGSKMPKPQPVTRMPDEQDPALRRARRAETESLIARSTAERAKSMSRDTIPGAASATPYTAKTLSGA